MTERAETLSRTHRNDTVGQPLAVLGQELSVVCLPTEPREELMKRNSKMPETYYIAPDYPDFLHRWLARGRLWDIEYKSYLSNHLTHNFIALGASGAPESRLAWWERLYTGELEDTPSREPGDLEQPNQFPRDDTAITESNWRNNLQTTRIAFPAYRDFFDARLAELGLSETLRRYAPTLMPGLAGAALHPLIHLGWATDVESLDMAGEGLAYMATAFQPLGTGPAHAPPAPLWSPTGTDILEAGLAYLTNDEADIWTVTAQNASETAHYKALNRGGFQQRVIAFDEPGLSLGRSLNSIGTFRLPRSEEALTPIIEDFVALMAIALEASDNEFFVLHGLTSLHGLLAILPHLEADDRRDALIHWFRAVLATMIAQGRPGLDRMAIGLEEWQEEKNSGSEPARYDIEAAHWWQNTLEATYDSHDEHVPKAVYALWRWSAWGIFTPATASRLRSAAKAISTAPEEGAVHDNLWFANAFSEASDAKEKRYD